MTKLVKYKRNKLKMMGEISWMAFAMSVVVVGLCLEKAFLKTKELIPKKA